MRHTLIACFALLLVASVSFAQTKIAVVNPAKILQDMEETKKSNEGFKAEQTAVKAQFDERQKKLADLEGQKNLLKPDAPQWTELNKQVVQMRTENEIWLKQADAELTRKFRDQAVKINGKIRAAIAEIAKAKGIQLVLSEQSDVADADLERIPLPQLMPVLLQRNVFYSDDSINITQDVLAKLDAGFKTTGG